MVGGLAEQSYREFFVDKLFLGVGGLSVEAGLTEYSLEDALVKRAMIKNAKERFVVADASKLNRVAFVHVAALSDVHALITDASADDAIVHRIQESGIRIWRA
jgi:DeoR/GlpR family transcriptional regulator of sugar metabolism